MSIIATSEQPLDKLEVTSFDLNCLAIDQSVSQLPPARFQYTMKGGSGHMHHQGTFSLLQRL